MRGNFDERLMQHKERLRAKHKLEGMHREAMRLHSDQQAHCAALRKRLASEKADVEKLEGLSLTGLFYTVLGTKADRLEQEQQEFLAAKLKYEEAVAASKAALAECERLREELAPLAEVDAEYERLIDEKIKLLATAGDGNAEKLLAQSEKLADLQADRKELQEAIEVGQFARNSLEDVQSALNTARDWGTWDLLGGGVISTMAKHSKIDAAKSHAQRAQRYLNRFQEELADADQRLHVSLEIGGFSKFADYFFDGLIADWVVQSKIRKASSACASATSQVTAALNECRARLLKTQQQIKQAEQDRKAFVEQA